MKNIAQKIKMSKFLGRIKYTKLVLILVLGVVIAFIGIIYMSKPSVNIDNEFLTIKSLFYGKSIPISEINTNDIKQINLKNDNNYNIKYRTDGIGMPNYYVGWMILNNGNKALVYLTDKTNVVLIPTNDYDVLISTNDFAGIIKELNKNIN